MRATLAVLVLLGCGGEAAAPSPPTPSSAIEPDPTTPTPTADEAAPPPAAGLVLPRHDAPAPSLRATSIRRHRVSWFDPHLPNERARRRVRSVVRTIARVWGDGFASAYQEEVFGDRADGCRAIWVHPRLVSVLCTSSRSPGRANGQRTRLRGVSLVLDGDVVRAARAEDAFTADGLAAIRAGASRRCARAFRRRHPDDEPAACGPDDVRALLLGPEGIVVAFDEEGNNEVTRPPLVVSVPYERAHVRENGLLAYVIGDAAVPSSAPIEGGTPGFAIGAPAPVPELAMRWARMPAAARDEVVLVSIGPALGQLATRDAERAHQLYGGTATPTAWADEPARLHLVRTTNDLNVRARDEDRASIEGVVARGTLGVALEGSLEGIGSARGLRRGRRTFLAVAPDAAGWVGAGVLAATSECVPSAGRFLAALPEAGGEDADERLRVARVSFGGEAGVTDAALFVTHTGDGTRAAIHSLSASCEVGDALVEAHLPGLPFDARLASSAPRGGRSVLVVGTWLANGHRRYAAFGEGRAAPLWRHTFTSAPTGDEALEAEASLELETNVREGDGFATLLYREPDGPVDRVVRLGVDDGELVELQEPPR